MREETLEDETSEIVWEKVTMKGCKNLYIAGCYRAKSDDSAFLDALSTSSYRITSNTVTVIIPSYLVVTLISLVGTGWLAPSNLNHNSLVCTRNLVI